MARVYTTIGIELETVGEAQPELLKQVFLVGSGFGDATERDLTAVGSGAFQRGEQSECSHRERAAERC
jgi:hypothetical protein